MDTPDQQTQVLLQAHVQIRTCLSLLWWSKQCEEQSDTGLCWLSSSVDTETDAEVERESERQGLANRWNTAVKQPHATPPSLCPSLFSSTIFVHLFLHRILSDPSIHAIISYFSASPHLTFLTLQAFYCYSILFAIVADSHKVSTEKVGKMQLTSSFLSPL